MIGWAYYKTITISDANMHADLAEKLGFPNAAHCIESHPRDYAEDVFRGFIVEAQEGKP